MRDATGKLPQGSSELTAQIMNDPAVMARLEATYHSLYDAETETRTVLNTAGAPVMLHLLYLDFARELWSLTNRVSGLAAVNEALILRNKWAARGLALEVLNRISYEVFSIRLPEAE